MIVFDDETEDAEARSLVFDTHVGPPPAWAHPDGKDRKAWLPLAFAPFGAPGKRFRAVYGGRGSAKSHSIAATLVDMGHKHTLRILCVREVQKTLDASVMQLIRDKIVSLGLSHHYTIFNSYIAGKNGTLFIFSGLQGNADGIKSMEGIDICWVEEAQTVSQASLNTLIPTIRKPWSEVWFSWNPRYAKDPVDKMFRGDKGPPPNTALVKMNYSDNPWFKDTALNADRIWDRDTDPDKYAHVWAGGYLKNSESRVFKNWKVQSFETPSNVERFYYGADWGFSIDPSVLIRCFVDGRKLYVDQEAYKVGCELDYTPALFAGTDTAKSPPRWENPYNWPGIPGALKWPIVGDSSRPETIAFMKRRGFQIIPSIKGAGSVEEGVEFLKNFEIIVHPRCEQTIDELTMYSFKVDKQTEEVLPALEDKKNHVIDALRYAVEKLRRAVAGENVREFYRLQAMQTASATAAAAAARPQGTTVVMSQSSDPDQHAGRVKVKPPTEIWCAYGISGIEYRQDGEGFMYLLTEDIRLAQQIGWQTLG